MIDSREKGEQEFKVLKENWRSVQMFLKLSTQWVWAGMGDRAGLNYQSLEFLLKLYPTKKRRRIFEDIQIMELAALQACQEGKD